MKKIPIQNLEIAKVVKNYIRDIFHFVEIGKTELPKNMTSP